MEFLNRILKNRRIEPHCIGGYIRFSDFIDSFTIKIALLLITSKVTNFGLPKSIACMPETPIHKFYGFRIESGRIFEGQIF
jgi:hypothetical protein